MERIEAKVEIHDTLNPAIWTNGKLRPDVRDNLLGIVEEFADFVDVPLQIIDAHLVGSNASYNYNEHSDLDLHVITNFENMDASPELLQALYNSEKRLFNEEYDLSIRNVNVEVYVEDVRALTVSNGIYSVFNDEWIKEPVHQNIKVDDDAIDANVAEVTKEVDYALLSQDPHEVNRMIDALYMMRKIGLSIDGEYGVGNQTFKEIRNSGKLQELKDKVIELRSKELSIYSGRDIDHITDLICL